MRRLTMLVGVAGLAACSGSSFSVSDQVLTGTVGGESWTFVQGETDAFLSEGEDNYFASFYPIDFDECGFDSPSDSNYLIVSVPKEVGEYDFGLQRNMTFVVGKAESPDNLVSFDGVVIVDRVTETSVRGGLHGVYDGDNEVDGKFELSICADR